MAYSVKKGSFAAETATGSKAYTGVGFQPKTLIMWVTPATASGYVADAALGIGFSDGTTDRGVAMWSDDGAAVTDSGHRHDTKSLLYVKDGTSTVGLAASVTSFDADGFTLNYSTADGTALLVHYIALGGTTLTNAKVGTIAAKTSTGTQAYTGVGFLPDALILIGVQLETAVPNNAVSAKMMVGVAAGANQGVVWMRDRDAQDPSDSVSRLQTTKVLTGTSSSSTTIVAEASLSSFDADGFTLNYSTAGALAFNYMYLALRGGSYFVGSEAQKTTTGTQSKTGVGFLPAGLIGFGIQQTAANTFTGASFALGGTDGTSEGFAWVQALNAQATSSANSAFATDKFIRFATSPSTTNAEADTSSLDADGFTLDWTIADATARQFVFLAVGPGTAPGGGGSVVAESQAAVTATQTYYLV